MGGGDLNLKKSWHPSTQKNIEKVWKAEQQNDAEKRRIAELRREIEMERDREEITQHAMQQGVIEKKDNMKLDWMYKGPNSTVNQEDYLLGKRIDKAFEDSLKASKNADSNRVSKNHVEHECVPPSLRDYVGTEQVDLQRKLREDPLYAIKKQEAETRAQLLKNPVRLKQLKKMLEQEEKRSHKKSKKHNLDGKLDVLLALKYKKLKGEIKAEDLIEELKSKKKKSKKRKKRRRDSSSSSSSSESSSESDNGSQKKKEKMHRSSSHEKSLKSRRHERNSLTERSTSHRDEHRDHDRHFRKSSYGLMNADGSRISTKKVSPSRERPVKSITKEEKKYISMKRKNLSEEEKQKRLKEMMKDAEERDKERSKIVSRFRKEEEKEISQKSFSKDFIRNELAKAAKSSSLESRIKSNLNNIQRSNNAMNSNFARR